MSRLIKGKEFVALLSEGLTIEDIAKRYNYTTQNVREVIRKYKQHLDLYNNCEIYKDLFDQYRADYGDRTEGGVVTRALNTLHRNNIYTKEDILSNKEKILDYKCRNLGKCTKELIRKTYFSDESSKAKEITATRKLKPILDNADAISLLTGICVRKITDYAVGKTDLGYTDVCKVNMALSYLRGGTNSLYSITNTMLIMHNSDSDSLEKFLCDFSKINASNKEDLIEFFMNSI